MQRSLIVIPKNLSQGIVESQVIQRFVNNSKACIFWFNKNHQSDCFNVNKCSGWRYVLFNVYKFESIYTRSVFDCLVFFIFKLLNPRIHLVFDFRGIMSEESFLRHENKLRKYVLRFFESIAFKLADEVWTVSENMSAYLLSRGVKVSQVCQCLLPQSKVSHKEIIADKKCFTFIYVGSMSVWQSFEQVCSLVSNFDFHYKFIVVTKDENKARAIISKYNVNCTFYSGEWGLVQEKLDQSDFGFVLRSDSIVNQTASPVKFLEYTARGVIPIVTPHVGDYSVLFRDTLVVNNLIDKIRLEDLEKIYRQDILDKLYSTTMKYTWEGVLNE